MPKTPQRKSLVRAHTGLSHRRAASVSGVILTLLLIAILAGGGFYLYQNQKNTSVADQAENPQEEEVNENAEPQTLRDVRRTKVEENVNEITGDGTGLSDGFIYALANPDQKPAPANPENLMTEMLIKHYDAAGKETTLATIENNFFAESFGLYQNKIYFITTSGELGQLELATDKVSTLKVKDIMASTDKYLNNNTISEMIVTDLGTIFYVQGYCEKGITTCSLHEYDIASGQQELILDDATFNLAVANTAMLLEKFDSTSKILTVIASGGDGPGAWATFYNIDTVKKTMTKTESVTKNSQCDSQDSPSQGCTEEEKANNEKYDALFHKPFTCHDFTITNAKYPLAFTGNSGETSWDNSAFIHCVN